MNLVDMSKVNSLLQFYMGDHEAWSCDLKIIDRAQEAALISVDYRVVGNRMFHSMEEFDNFFSGDTPSHIAEVIIHGYDAVRSGSYRPFRLYDRDFFYFDIYGRLISTNDISDIYLDCLNTDFIRKIVSIIIPFMSEEYTEQLSGGARDILGL